jgi:dTMP kinase
MRGALVVLDGTEGAGKSTQARLLVERFQRAGLRALAVREPGGTPQGDAIRDLLLDPRRTLDARAEALLFMASRAQLVHDVIRPALDAGQVVVADRFFLATYAYQVAGRGLPEDEIRRANALATGGLVPDITLLLSLPVAEGLRRAGARGEHDRMERSGDAFHERVAAAFQAFAEPAWQATHPESGPIVLIDASGPVAAVTSRIDEALAGRWPGLPGGLATPSP